MPLLSTIAAAAAPEDEPVHEPGPPELIIVTGYHIKRIDAEGPAPVVIFDGAMLERSGVNTLAEFARYLPFNAQTLADASTQFVGAPGTAQFNLRAIGLDATLTLLNGRRVAPYAETQSTETFVDINAIPLAAVDRIEVLKDGASAIYGAEALAGVVNIVLRQRTTGFELEAGLRRAAADGLDELDLALSGGWSNGRTSISGFATWLDRDGLRASDRAFSSSADFRDRGGIDARFPISSPPTVFLTEEFRFVPDLACPADRIAVFGRDSACLCDYAPFATLILPTDRLAAFTSIESEVSDRLFAFAELFASRTRHVAESAPARIAGLGGLPTITGLPLVQATHPDNPYGQDVEITFRTLQSGNREARPEAQSYRAVAGMRGELDRWHFDFALDWSRSEVETSNLNEVLVPAFQAALLGAGGPKANQYFSPFGLNPFNPPEVVDRFTVDAFHGATRHETGVDLAVTGDLLRLAAGSVAVAVGLQYRDQDLEQFVDEVAKAIGFNPQVIVADRDLRSTYVELALPLPGRVELQLAGRFEDYSDFGSELSPKLALAWRTADSVLLRGSWGTSFRPPSFEEQFLPRAEIDAVLIDTPRCAVTGAAEDCEPFLFNTFREGNPDLEPEEGESLYVGVVWSPLRPSGLRVGLDLWKYRHEHRVLLPAPQFLLDSFPPDNEFVFRRPQTPAEVAAGIPGRIDSVHQTYINFDQLETRGIDVELRYSWQTQRRGEFALATMYTYLDRYEFVESLEDSAIPAAGGESFSLRGNLAGRYFANGPLPRHRGNVTLDWLRGADGATGTLHYVGGYVSPVELHVDGTPTGRPFRVPDWWSLDLQYSRTFARLNGATLRIGCENCVDQQPPTYNYTELGENLHDVRGTLFYARWTQPF